MPRKQQGVIFDWTISQLRDSYERALRVANRAENTVRSYMLCLDTFIAFLDHSGASQRVRDITTATIQDFLLAHTHWKASTRQLYFVQLRGFFNWCLQEGDIIDLSPMATMKRPQAPEPEPRILTDDELRALLATCKSRTAFKDVRDLALIRFFLDTGIRLAEMAAIRLDDLNLHPSEQYVSIPHGKGDKYRIVPFGNKAAQALDRYLRMRKGHKDADLPWLWLGTQGQLKRKGIQDLFLQRAQMAGIAHVHPHLLRHTFVDRLKESDMHEEDIMTLTGHTTTTMLHRYAKSRRRQRALDDYHHRKRAPGDAL